MTGIDVIPVTGIDIIAELLANHPPLLVAVPIVRIKAGVLPEGIALDAILLRSISSVDHQLLAAEAKERLIERIRVTVRAETYDRQRALIQIIRHACKDRVGDFAGATSCSILAAGIGPDMLGPSASFEQAQDFRVSFERDA